MRMLRDFILAFGQPCGDGNRVRWQRHVTHRGNFLKLPKSQQGVAELPRENAGTRIRTSRRNACGKAEFCLHVFPEVPPLSKDL